MKVSVIIPAYQAAPYIAETIDSLLAQTHQEIEVIVVDDGSTDDTAAVIGRYPDVRYFYQTNHGCCGAARNTALFHATGEYIAFIDADDLATPDRLAAQAHFLEVHPEVGVVYTNYRNFKSEAFEPNHYTTCPRIRAALVGGQAVLQPLEARDLLLDENYALPSTCMIRRAVLTSVPGFSTVKGGEDILFAYQVAQKWPVGLLDMIGCERRLHDGNVSGSANPFPYMKGQILSRQLMAATEESESLRAKIAAWIRRRQSQMALEYANRDMIGKSFEMSMAARNYTLLLRTAILAALPGNSWRWKNTAGNGWGKKKPSAMVV
jgi:glycosyltransferase involved in cell wall biosynthesis